jgi:hypothetical protein
MRARLEGLGVDSMAARRLESEIRAKERMLEALGAFPADLPPFWEKLIARYDEANLAEMPPEERINALAQLLAETLHEERGE